MNVIDDFNRGALWIEVDTFLSTECVVSGLEGFLLCWSNSKQIRMDNSPELIAERLKKLVNEKQIELIDIPPDKPAQNDYIEPFNQTFHGEVIDDY